MATWFFSDPHLGVSRSSHTTAQSRMRLKDAVYSHLVEALDDMDGLPKLGAPKARKVCLGDLFDKEANDEAAILQGLEVAARCRAVLAGNHDVPGREGKVSSLALVESALHFSEGGCPVVLAGPGEAGFEAVRLVEATLLMVPHVSSQELFEESLRMALDESLRIALEAPLRILCLHCNYDSPFAQADSTLNLTRERAETLLDAFDYILLGHEHKPREDFGGRLIVLGNTHPASFADISDKYVWRLEGGKLEKTRVWSEDRAVEIDWRTLLEGQDEGRLAMAQFVTVAGKAPAARLPEIAEAVAGLWKRCGDALMVRNMVEAEDSLADSEAAVHRAMSLPDRVAAALAGTELEGLWGEYLGRAA